MANVTIKSALVLDRLRGSFVDKATGQTVDYAQVRLQEKSTRDLFVVSTKDEGVLASMVPGESVGPLDFEVVEPTSVRATKVRPAGGSTNSGVVRF